VHGLEHGISQICRLASGRADQTFVWNYPIDLSLKSTNAFGWPQLVISVYRINAMGKDVVCAYGSIHIPTTPGRHICYLRLYRPVSSSMCQRITSWLLGSPPEFFNAKFTAQSRGREVTRVASAGTIKLVFNVATRGMAAWGYQVADSAAVVSMPSQAAPTGSLGADNSFTPVGTTSARGGRG
jgi:B9 domain-containing protein 1